MKIAETSIVVLLLSIITPAFTNSSPPTWNPYSPYTGYLDNIDEANDAIMSAVICFIQTMMPSRSSFLAPCLTPL